MKNKINMFVTLFWVSTAMLMAQTKKDFTLEDLIPGGSNYYNCTAKNIYGLQWWGDRCMMPDVDEVKVVDPRKGEESVLFTLDEINQSLSAYTKTSLGHLRTLQNCSFPDPERPIVLFRLPLCLVYVDFEQKQVDHVIGFDQAAANMEISPDHRAVAYTVGDALYVNCTDRADTQELLSPEFADSVTAPKPHDIVYGQAVHRNEFGIVKGIFWSPKGSSVAFYRMDQSMVTDYPQVNLDTRIATLEPDKYPMAGMDSHKVTVGIYRLADNRVVYLNTGDPTDRYFTNISWTPDEEKIYVIELNRDQNHAQLVRYDAVSGEREAVVYEEKHPKYVEPQQPITFLPWDHTQFICQSQRDGYNHLYLCDTTKESDESGWMESPNGGTYRTTIAMRSLTQGDWLVQSIVGFYDKKKEIVITSTEVSPMQTNTYAVSIRNGKRRLLGNDEGVHRVQLSAGGTYLIDNYSSPDIPRNIDLISTADGKVTKNLLTADDPWADYKVPLIETGTIKAADGTTDLYYRLVKPADFDPTRKYPAIVYVYGGPHAQMLINTFHYGVRGWDIYMAQKGYIMFTVDNRGSSNRGLAFENCTFRQLGTEEMKDQLEGVEFLKSLPYVDNHRLGVHGWSFGGFMTTNLMLTYPDVFKVGVAGGPVIDWEYYEIMYGERYMDHPKENPEGYKQSNLRLRAGNLKGRLELIIGGNDPVCVPQHTLSFIRACIDAGTHPDLFIYPGQGHNMAGRDRVHLHEHITRYFEEHL